ncbi:MAG: hypothetical protein AAB304_05050 [Pseudomonadota bacterium]
MHIVKQVFLKFGIVIVLMAIIGLGGWTWFTLSYNYSDGERAGYIQKFSRKGWVCKTWEGEMSMINYTGAAPEIFRFSVREDKMAKDIEAIVGKRVALHYEQHVNVPTNCFGETEYFITSLRVIE